MSLPAPRLLALAMATAGLMISYQASSKALRDALFLTHFPPSLLPAMVLLGALFSILLGLGSSALLARFTPARVVPPLLIGSGVLQLGEAFALEASPRTLAVLIYLHVHGLGAVLLSGMWSVFSERFDPREAKRNFGRIAGTGTLGGILGGVATARVAGAFGAEGVLFVLAALHLAAAAILHPLRGPRAPRRTGAEELLTTTQAFARAPYLITLAALVLTATASAALLDLQFKTLASATIGKGPALIAYFGYFQAATQALAFVLQVFVSAVALEKLGLGRTVAAMPLAVIAGGATAMVAPQLAAVTIGRALEAVLRGSLFRAGYELFYTPVPVAERRSAKSTIDVGADRLGDAVGGGIAQFLLAFGPSRAALLLPAASATLGAVALFITRRLDRGYVRALETSLLNRAVELDLPDASDSTTRTILLRTLPALRIAPRPPVTRGPQPAYAPRMIADPVLVQLAELRSGDAARVRAVLARPDPPDPVLVPQLIRLLAWDEAASDVARVLLQWAPAFMGQLTDALVNGSEEFAVRRRIPAILASSDASRSIDGLLRGLKDARFEVRYRCARALDAIARRNPERKPPPERVLPAVERELSLSRTIWGAHRLIDPTESADGLETGDAAHNQAGEPDRGLEHIFTLLALVQPREPLIVAYRALRANDKYIRALALEYLDSTLPGSVREGLHKLLAIAPLETVRPAEQVYADLMKTKV